MQAKDGARAWAVKGSDENQSITEHQKQDSEGEWTRDQS